VERKTGGVQLFSISVLRLCSSVSPTLCRSVLHVVGTQAGAIGLLAGQPPVPGSRSRSAAARAAVLAVRAVQGRPAAACSLRAQRMPDRPVRRATCVNAATQRQLGVLQLNAVEQLGGNHRPCEPLRRHPHPSTPLPAASMEPLRLLVFWGASGLACLSRAAASCRASTPKRLAPESRSTRTPCFLPCPCLQRRLPRNGAARVLRGWQPHHHRPGGRPHHRHPQRIHSLQHERWCGAAFLRFVTCVLWFGDGVHGSGL
jgi:hypothetical protein